MGIMAKVSLVLVVILVSLAAYLRLAHSGIGCADWPDCYGRLGVVPAATLALSDQSYRQASAYQTAGISANEPVAWATPAHRLVASALGLLITGMTILSFRSRKHRLICLLLLGLTVFLAVLGIKSGGLHSPAVVMGNLAGGFSLLGLLGWLTLGNGRPVVGEHTGLRAWAAGLIGVLALQIILGGLTSANFAATACNTLPDCHGSYLPGPAVVKVFDLSREHRVDATGVVVGGAEQADIHKLHRLGAVIVLVTGLITGVIAMRAGGGFAPVGAVIILLVVIEFSIGIAAIVTQLPIGLAVAHNWVAGLLLLSIIRLLAVSRKSVYR